MKKAISVFLLLALAASLLGCSIYDENVGSNISMFVDPTNNLAGSSVPDDNADSTVTPEPESEPEPLTPGFTRLDNPDIVEEYYYGPGNVFRLYIPFTWRSHIAIEILTEEDGSSTITTYDFLYVQDDGVETSMFKLLACPPGYTNSSKLSGSDLLGTNDAGTTTYYMYRLTETMPEGFTDVDEYLEIYQKLGEAENSGFEILD